MNGAALDRLWWNSCTKKHAYATLARAERAAHSSARHYGHGFRVYKCVICPGWHVASVKEAA